MKEPQFKFKKKTNKKIHISFFIGSLEIGGTEKQFINIINSLDQKNSKLIFICYQAKKVNYLKN